MTQPSGSENSAVGPLPRSGEPPGVANNATNSPASFYTKPVFLFRSFKDGLPAKVVGPHGVSRNVEKALEDFASKVVPPLPEALNQGTRVILESDPQGNGVLYARPEELCSSAPQTATLVFEEGNVKIVAYPIGLTDQDHVLVQVKVPALPTTHLAFGRGGSTTDAPPFALEIAEELKGQLLSWVRTGPAASTLVRFSQKQPVGIAMTVLVPKTSRLIAKSVSFEVKFQVADGSSICRFCKGFHRRETCTLAPECKHYGSSAHSNLMCRRLKPATKPAAAKPSDDGFTSYVSKHKQRRIEAEKKKAAALDRQQRAKQAKAPKKSRQANKPKDPKNAQAKEAPSKPKTSGPSPTTSGKTQQPDPLTSPDPTTEPVQTGAQHSTQPESSAESEPTVPAHFSDPEQAAKNLSERELRAWKRAEAKRKAEEEKASKESGTPLPPP